MVASAVKAASSGGAHAGSNARRERSVPAGRSSLPSRFPRIASRRLVCASRPRSAAARGCGHAQLAGRAGAQRAISGPGARIPAPRLLRRGKAGTRAWIPAPRLLRRGKGAPRRGYQRPHCYRGERRAPGWIPAPGLLPGTNSGRPRTNADAANKRGRREQTRKAPGEERTAARWMRLRPVRRSGLGTPSGASPTPRL